MRTTVLTWSLIIAVVCSAQSARAQGQDWLGLGQSPDGWQSSDGSGDFADDPDISADAPSFIRPRYWFLPPKFETYFQADVLYLARFSDAGQQPIAVDLSSNTTVMSTNDARLSNTWRPGMMFTLGVNLDQIAQVEATYWGLNTWRNGASVNIPAPPPLTGRLGLAGDLQTHTTDFEFADRMSIDYVARMNNAEINYKQMINGVTLLGGVRYFRLLETFDINSQSASFGTSSDYNVTTVNNLVGAQFGLGYTQEMGPLNIGILAKIGPYLNAVHQSTLLQDFGNSLTLRNYSKDGMPVSTLGEVQVNALYRVTDWLSVHAGYRFFWIQNLALAPDQLDLTNSAVGTKILNSHNHLFLQGFNAGAEIRW
ncbi:MAG: BBP7 family outer membrane beta-barrel protein [Planctomycetia bacterium]|nr:BBP7 family outer membrane beta-barrel protein [Planctomycetia bacterium]